MTFIRHDTIAAVATAPLSAGVAVVRVSGAKAKAMADKIAPKFKNTPPKRMQFVRLKNPDGPVDEGLMVWFKGPHSFTGEDVVEFHGHGGPAVVQAVLDLFYGAGAVPAEAGEFTRRAFINGKMDLTQAEGLADLIAAGTEQQRKQALRQMGGELGETFEQWRRDIMHLVAHVEAAIDFPDEELDVLAEAGLAEKLDNLIKTFQQASQTQAGQRLREGFSVAIVGRPNSGKSTLTNKLSGKETAIVSPIEGTTRDIVETHLDIAGYPIVLADTAGLRHTKDTIEAEGVSRAGKKAAEADIVILVTDANHWPTLDPQGAAYLKKGQGLVVVSKTDKTPVKANSITYKGVTYPVVACNLTAPDSLAAILPPLTALIRQTFEKAASAAQLNRERHKAAVNQARKHLERAQKLYQAPPTGISLSDMLAQDLRDAAAAIGSVTGKTDTEDVLDLVFSTFCIGK